MSDRIFQQVHFFLGREFDKIFIVKILFAIFWLFLIIFTLFKSSRLNDKFADVPMRIINVIVSSSSENETFELSYSSISAYRLKAPYETKCKDSNSEVFLHNPFLRFVHRDYDQTPALFQRNSVLSEVPINPSLYQHQMPQPIGTYSLDMMLKT